MSVIDAVRHAGGILGRSEGGRGAMGPVLLTNVPSLQIGPWQLRRSRKGDGFRCFVTAAATVTELDDLLLRLARKLGAPIPGRRGALVEPIVPIVQQNAEPGSLSAIHGLGALPMHMDSAHHFRPARFLLIGCVDPGSSGAQTRLVDTTQLDFTAAERALLISTPLFIRSGRRSFYASILDQGRPFLRYDPGCMEPVDQRGEEALVVMRRAVDRLPVERHGWKSGEVLMIDNWRMLHGRTAAAVDGRLLLRVTVR